MPLTNYSISTCPYCSVNYQGSKREIEGKIQRHLRLIHGETQVKFDQKKETHRVDKGNKQQVMKALNIIN